MAATFDAAEPGAQKRNALPPWPWFWLIIYILGLPTTFSLIGSDLFSLFTPAPAPGANTGDLFPVVYGLIQQATSIGELLLYLALLLGVLSLLFPSLRAGFLERRYQLTAPDELPPLTLQTTRQTLVEASDLLQCYAPGLIVKYSTSARPLPGYAFVYPIGYRKMGIALSGALLTRWRNDRPAAEAILLHEIAHYRQGDAYIVGAGSPVEMIVRSWPLLYAVFFFLPLLLFFIIEQISIAQTFFALQPYLQSSLQTDISLYLRQVFTMDLPFFLITLFTELFWTASLYIIVLMSIWCAELNADRFVADTMQSPTALLAAIEHHSAPSSLPRWLFSGLPHPPGRIRSRIVRRSQGTGGLALLLLLFPAAWLIRAVFLLGWAICYQLPLLYNNTSMGDIVVSTLVAFVGALKTALVLWLAVSALLALWPFLARYWEGFFGRVRHPLVGAKYPAYLLSTGVLLVICMMCLALSTPSAPVSGQAGPSTPASTAPSSGYIALARAYQGSVVNTTDNANVQSSVSLASIRQDQQGHITCYLTIQPPLVGSGPCTGSVSKNGRIQFTVMPDDGSGIASIQFTGTLHPDGSMNGTYTLPGTNEVGTWQLSPS